MIYAGTQTTKAPPAVCRSKKIERDSLVYTFVSLHKLGVKGKSIDRFFNFCVFALSTCFLLHFLFAENHLTNLKHVTLATTTLARHWLCFLCFVSFTEFVFFFIATIVSSPDNTV